MSSPNICLICLPLSIAAASAADSPSLQQLGGKHRSNSSRITSCNPVIFNRITLGEKDRTQPCDCRQLMIHGHQCTVWGHPGQCRLLLPLRSLCAETQGLFSCSWPQSLTLRSQHHPAAGGWASSWAGWSSPVRNRNDQACSLGACALGLTGCWTEL